MKKMNNKGFTLAELLIVVAIIAVLVAISIPIFTTQLEKARETTDLANIRSACSELVSGYLSGDRTTKAIVNLTQTQQYWQYVTPEIGTSITIGSTSTGKIKFTGNPYKGFKAFISIDDTTGEITIEFSTNLYGFG